MLKIILLLLIIIKELLMVNNLSLEEKFDIIQEEIYVIKILQSVFEDILVYNDKNSGIYEKFITLLKLQQEHLNKISNLF